MKELILIYLKGDPTMGYCKDGQFRRLPIFGTPSWTTKIYTSRKAAINKANKIGGVAVSIPDGVIVGTGGRLTRTVPCEDQEGYTRTTVLPIDQFIIN